MCLKCSLATPRHGLGGGVVCILSRLSSSELIGFSSSPGLQLVFGVAFSEQPGIISHVGHQHFPIMLSPPGVIWRAPPLLGWARLFACQPQSQRLHVLPEHTSPACSKLDDLSLFAFSNHFSSLPSTPSVLSLQQQYSAVISQPRKSASFPCWTGAGSTQNNASSKMTQVSSMRCLLQRQSLGRGLTDCRYVKL